MKEMEQNSTFLLSLIQTGASLLSIHLLKNYCNVTHKVSQYNDKPAKVEYIEDNVGSNISLDTLADMSNMSTYHFIRTFKNTMGTSPHKYIVHVRMVKAKKLLKETNMTIAEVGKLLGYSVSHFTQVFRQCIGCTPRQFRKQNYKTILVVN